MIWQVWLTWWSYWQSSNGNISWFCRVPSPPDMQNLEVEAFQIRGFIPDQHATHPLVSRYDVFPPLLGISMGISWCHSCVKLQLVVVALWQDPLKHVYALRRMWSAWLFWASKYAVTQWWAWLMSEAGQGQAPIVAFWLFFYKIMIWASNICWQQSCSNHLMDSFLDFTHCDECCKHSSFCQILLFIMVAWMYCGLLFLLHSMNEYWEMGWCQSVEKTCVNAVSVLMQWVLASSSCVCCCVVWILCWPQTV